MAVKEIVALCRKRDTEGDCPSAGLPSAETLEFCILDLASQLDTARRDTLVTLADALRKVSPRSLELIVSDFETYKTKLALRDEAFENLLAALKASPANETTS